MSEPELVFALAGGQNAFFRELAEALSFELQRLDASSRVVVDEFPAPTDGRVVVLLPPQEFADFSGAALAPALLRRCVMVSAERPAAATFPRNLELGRQAGAVLDFHRPAVAAYRAAGVGAEHLQLGYSEAWDGRDKAVERDIDVLFLGRSTERRERALAGYADLLERFRCEFILSDPRFPNAHEGPSFVTKESKLRLLARSKVLLNVRAEEGLDFEWLRAAEAISCGCVVVSEHSTDLEPLQPGVDLSTGSCDSLAYLVAAMVDDDERRAEMAREAESRLRSVPLADAAAKLLEVARRVGARPPAPQVAAQARVVQARAASIPFLTPEPAPASPEDTTAAAVEWALQALARRQQELRVLRRRLGVAVLAASRPDDPAPRTVEEAVTPAWKEKSRPVVSVVVPLCDDAAFVAEALESVRRSTMRSWEIVVVDDACGEDAAVREWMKSHPDRRLSLVRHEVNRGRPAARNTGARQARGELLLMLDPNKLIRPFGMARLVAALVKDRGAAFAYGILDSFEADERVGVVSKFGWDLLRFRSENYIDGLAMIRRRALFELGGYSEDPRLELGLEDYDLWVRMAEDDRRAAFVREFVGSYRIGHEPVLAGIPAPGATAAIVEHAPDLMREAALSRSQ